MKLYNTLTRKKEIFTPIDGKTAKIYTCGPTVYFSAHIGNMRAYIFTDILKKTLELAGHDVMDVMNITDVGHLTSDADDGEDKMEQSAKAQGLKPMEIAKKYTDEYMRDCKKLNIRDAKIIAPATNYIDQMIEFIKGLEQKGFTYKTSDGVYFDASKFANYTQLSGAKIEGNRGGARIDLGEKRNINDFALWKFCGANVIQKWESPWGVGCPGWHIECSAIALHYFGHTFDIHTGGIDHIPIHHTNEIAQTESLTGKKMCNFWCHNEFMQVDNGKMGKSLGNAYTLTDLENRGFSPMHFRYFVLLASYRSVLNFTFDGLKSAQTAYNNIVSLLAKHSVSPKAKQPTSDINKLWKQFRDEITDDLNTPKAIAVLWSALKLPASRDIYDLIIRMDTTLSLGLADAVNQYLTPTDIPQDILSLAEQRLTAKKNKDWATADKLRTQITSLGYEILDTKDGYTLKKASQ